MPIQAGGLRSWSIQGDIQRSLIEDYNRAPGLPLVHSTVVGWNEVRGRFAAIGGR